MVELTDENLKNFERHSSKGNQLKFKSNDLWYKADYTGYEGLSEFLISKALTKSNLKADEFVVYEPEQIKYKRRVMNGVKSENFLPEDKQLITLQRLYNIRYNRDLMQDIWHIKEVEGRIEYLVSRVEEMTGINNFGLYLSKMLTIDALFLNEDRHMHNIAVLMDKDGKFSLCPFFDHGAGLLSDTTIDYPLDADIYELINEVKGKTVTQSFDEALDAVEKLHGQSLRFNYSEKDINLWLDSINIYPNEIKNRVKTIMFLQRKKYSYLF